MTKLLAWTFALLLIAGCGSTPLTQRDREILAADVRDVVSSVATLSSEKTRPYFEALDSLLQAFVSSKDGFDWATAFDAVRAQEPALRAAMEDAGWSPEKIEAIVLGARILLRRVESQVVAQPPPEAPATTASIARAEIAPSSPLATVTPVTELREMTTVYAGGGWHFRGGKRADILGDLAMSWAYVDGQVYLVAMVHMGTPPPSGSFWFRPYHDPDFPSIYEGWRQGTTKWGKVWEPPIGSLRAPPGAVNIDTHTVAQLPGPWTFHWIHGVRDNVTLRYHLERATSSTIDASPDAFTRFTEDLVSAPSEECSLVIVPWSATAELYYVRKSEETPDGYGVTFRSRLYRREAKLAGFDELPRFGPEQLVFEPSQGGQGAWGTANTTIQPGICVLPDRRRLMLALGKQPFSHPNGEPAQGLMNDSCAVGAWLSRDGLAWEPAGNNPCLSRKFLGLATPSKFANQLNSPQPWVDPITGKVYAVIVENRTNNVYQLGTRIMMCELSVR